MTLDAAETPLTTTPHRRLLVGGSEAGAVREIDEGGTNSDGKRKGVEETLVAVNNAGLDGIDGNVELEAVDTTASDPRESKGKSLREGNKAIRSSQAQVS